MPESLAGGVPHLQEARLGGGGGLGLSGTLPTSFTQLKSLRTLIVTGNNFEYDPRAIEPAAIPLATPPHAQPDERLPTFWTLRRYDEENNALSRFCRSYGVDCPGVPPRGCGAFGGDWVVAVDNPEARSDSTFPAPPLHLPCIFRTSACKTSWIPPLVSLFIQYILFMTSPLVVI